MHKIIFENESKEVFASKSDINDEATRIVCMWVQ